MAVASACAGVLPYGALSMAARCASAAIRSEDSPVISWYSEAGESQ
jgi:hypothetical protein